jgi:biopolymer transport protein ExbB/TolQ
MDILQRASEFENRKWSGISTSDRVQASRDLKQLILDINEQYKKTRDQHLMDIMKRLTAIKRKVEARLKGSLEV